MSEMPVAMRVNFMFTGNNMYEVCSLEQWQKKRYKKAQHEPYSAEAAFLRSVACKYFSKSFHVGLIELVDIDHHPHPKFQQNVCYPLEGACRICQKPEQSIHQARQQAH